MPTRSRFPRTRGDEPGYEVQPSSEPPVFPAHAGMSPELVLETLAANRFPRTRGDEPRIEKSLDEHGMFSPHTRG